MEVNATYIFHEYEYIFGVSYEKRFPSIMLRSQADVQYFSFDNGISRKHDAFMLLSFQNDPFYDRLVFTFNIGVDSFTRKILTGLGLETLFGNVFSLIAEYSPKSASYSFGPKFRVGGHQFLFYFGDSTEIGARRFMSENPQQKAIHFGFSIQRLF